jgi:hypothetical protein
MFLVFMFFFLINIITAGGHLDPWDGIEAFLVTESMVLKHTAKLDPTVPSVEKLHFNVRYTVYSNKVIQTKKYFNESTIPLEPVYTVRSLLLSATAVPFYYVALLLSISPLLTIGLLVNSLLISLTCVVMFCFSLELYASRKMLAFAESLIFGACSFVLPYHTSFWAQPLQTLTLITSAYFIYKSIHYSSSFLCYYLRPSYIHNYNITDKNNNNNGNQNKGIYFAGLGGLFLGLSVFSHATSIVLIPGFVLYSFLSMRRTRNLEALYSFIIMLGIVLFLIGVVNYLRFGSFTEFGYGYFGSLAVHDGWRGLVGLLISPGASLFLYFPVSILIPLAAKYTFDKKENRQLLFLFSYIIVVSWLDAGTLSFNFEPFAWWGTGWGPRYLVPVLPFVTLMLGSVFVHMKRKKGFTLSSSFLVKFSIIALSIASFYITIIGTIIWWQYDIVYVGAQKEQLWNKDPWNSIVWDPSHSPIVLHTKMLLADYVAHINPHKYANTSWHWITYGLAPCSYDMYIFCKFGFIPVLLIALVIAALGVLIIKQIRGARTIKFTFTNIYYHWSDKKSSLSY